MGEVQRCSGVMLFLAAFSRHDDALDWARERASAAFGPIALMSDRFDFVETEYYEPTMGAGLRKQFFVFETLIDPAKLPQIKIETNQWETLYAAQGPKDESRPLNLDPGYLTLAKLVLASTKDHAHRIYLADGILAEVTLHYQHGQWRHRDWTFPDYRRADYHAFLDRAREIYRRAKAEAMTS